jgi:DNA-binding response OmpR family regulator
MTLEGRGAAVLVIGDDAELSGLIALNLRSRGFLVEHTDFGLATAPRWAPSFGRPSLVIVNVESPQRASPQQLNRLMASAWAEGVPLILAADNPVDLAKSLARPPIASLPRPGDIGAIVTAARSVTS